MVWRCFQIASDGKMRFQYQQYPLNEYKCLNFLLVVGQAIGVTTNGSKILPVILLTSAIKRFRMVSIKAESNKMK